MRWLGTMGLPAGPQAMQLLRNGAGLTICSKRWRSAQVSRWVSRKPTEHSYRVL
jgi:hypothetical protein